MKTNNSKALGRPKMVPKNLQEVFQDLAVEFDMSFDLAFEVQFISKKMTFTWMEFEEWFPGSKRQTPRPRTSPRQQPPVAHALGP